MRTYRVWWTAAVAAATVAALVLGSSAVSPWVFVAEAISIGVMAGTFGYAWEEDPQRRWVRARTWAVRGAVAAALLTGLPPVMGSWSLLLLIALGALTPEALLAVRRMRNKRHDRETGPVWGASDQALVRRWKYTSIAVRSAWRTPQEVLLLVQERQQLLDELERRDPDGFALWLVSSGWSQPQDR